jgi:hypothetical protein
MVGPSPGPSPASTQHVRWFAIAVETTSTVDPPRLWPSTIKL